MGGELCTDTGTRTHQNFRHTIRAAHYAWYSYARIVPYRNICSYWVNMGQTDKPPKTKRGGGGERPKNEAGGEKKKTPPLVRAGEKKKKIFRTRYIYVRVRDASIYVPVSTRTYIRYMSYLWEVLLRGAIVNRTKYC